jgi:pyruvate dehydrogenase E2 component (dihydrolipoamide acetyltransferase)
VSGEIRVPNFGVSVTEVVISGWAKRVGDEVSEGEIICEVETEKSSAEVEAPSSGRLTQILAEAGATVRVGDIIARLGSSVQLDAEAAGANTPPVGSGNALGTHAIPPAGIEEGAGAPAERHRVLSTPLARDAAEQFQVDISDVAAQRGEPVRRADVLAVASTLRSRITEAKLPREYEDIPHHDEPTNSIRRVMGERMAQSAASVVHMTMQVDVDMSSLEAVRGEVHALRTDGLRITALSFVARAAISILTNHPRLNASLISGVLRQWHRVNLGVAVDTPHGLVVPVIQDARRFNVEEIADAIRHLAAGARSRRLRPEDFIAPTFTISNPGVLGAVEAPAIISLPQIATLGMAAIVRMPTVVMGADGEEHVLVRPIMRAALTYDHRALDGGDVGRFLKDLKSALETWRQDDYRQ